MVIKPHDIKFRCQNQVWKHDFCPEKIGLYKQKDKRQLHQNLTHTGTRSHTKPWWGRDNDTWNKHEIQHTQVQGETLYTVVKPIINHPRITINGYYKPSPNHTFIWHWVAHITLHLPRVIVQLFDCFIQAFNIFHLKEQCFPNRGTPPAHTQTYIHTHRYISVRIREGTWTTTLFYRDWKVSGLENAGVWKKKCF